LFRSTGDYATPISHQIRDGTGPIRLDPKNASAHGKARNMIAARAAGKSAKARAIHVASRARSSS